MGSVESGLNEGRGFHQAQASIDNTTSTNFPQKCFCEFTLITSFIFVLLAGLNLTTASLFEEQVNHEELGKLQFNFNLAVLLGLLMLVYPIAGLVLNCRNKLPGKVRDMRFFLSSSRYNCIEQSNSNFL